MKLRQMLSAAAVAALTGCAAPAPEPALEVTPSPAVEPPVTPVEVAIERCKELQATESAAGEPLTPIRREPAPYPARALAAGIEGGCLMTFEVAGNGFVDRKTVVASCSDPAFETPAMRAVERWCFRPSTDAAERRSYQARMNFTLADEDPSPEQ